MTGIIILFTGRLLPVITLQSGRTCVADSVANVATIMGYEVTPTELIKELNLNDAGYVTDELNLSLPRFNISRGRYTSEKEIKELLKKQPLMGAVFGSGINSEGVYVTGHGFAIVGVYSSGIIIANSRGTGRGLGGYGRVTYDEVDNIYIHTIGHTTTRPKRKQIGKTRKKTKEEKTLDVLEGMRKSRNR